MKVAEDAAVAIQRQTKEIVKVAKTYKFQELAQHVAKLKATIEAANKLPGANGKVNTDEYEYPPKRLTEYLRGEKSSAIVEKIEATASEYACNCDPVKCQCIVSDEIVAPADSPSCHFCADKIKEGSPLHTGEGTGTKMCQTCARILWEKVRLKESVAYAVINLCEDASSEADAPFFQFKKAMQFIEEAQERLEAFRLVQRAKVAR
jgi:hypothetical protein